MATTRKVTVYTGSPASRARLRETGGHSKTGLKEVDAIEVDDYVTDGYIGSIKFAITVYRMRAFVSVKDVVRMFGIDMAKSAKAVNEYMEELVPVDTFAKIVRESSGESDRLAYVVRSADNIIQLMKRQ